MIDSVGEEGWFRTKHPSEVACVFCYVMVVFCILWMLIMGGVN